MPVPVAQGASFTFATIQYKHTLTSAMPFRAANAIMLYLVDIAFITAYFISFAFWCAPLCVFVLAVGWLSAMSCGLRQVAMRRATGDNGGHVPAHSTLTPHPSPLTPRLSRLAHCTGPTCSGRVPTKTRRRAST